MLKTNTLFGEEDKVAIAIERLKAFEPEDGYYVAYSGGKDSDVVLDLVKRSGVKFDAHYNVSSVDAPDTIYYIRNKHPEVKFGFPRDSNGNIVTMWNLIARKRMPPLRMVRYCCYYLKEANGRGRVVVTGVRWAESTNRKNNRGLVNIGARKDRTIILNNDNDESKRMVEQCYRTQTTLVNPIIDWEDADVWEYIHTNNLPYNPLYDKGYKRVGCVGCPMNRNQKSELEKFPQLKRLYIRAFDKMLNNYTEEERKTMSWKNGEDVYNWWVNPDVGLNSIQTSLFEEEDLIKAGTITEE